jgi:hypothetical protein
MFLMQSFTHPFGGFSGPMHRSIASPSSCVRSFWARQYAPLNYEDRQGGEEKT